jgi:hypothetical protein
MKGAREISALHEASATAIGGITKAATWGSRTGLREDNRSFLASNMMAVKHNAKSAIAKNTVKAAALVPLAVAAVSTKSLKLLSTLHSEDS